MFFCCSPQEEDSSNEGNQNNKSQLGGISNSSSPEKGNTQSTKGKEKEKQIHGSYNRSSIPESLGIQTDKKSIQIQNTNQKQVSQNSSQISNNQQGRNNSIKKNEESDQKLVNSFKENLKESQNQKNQEVKKTNFDANLIRRTESDNNTSFQPSQIRDNSDGIAKILEKKQVYFMAETIIKEYEGKLSKLPCEQLILIEGEQYENSILVKLTEHCLSLKQKKVSEDFDACVIFSKHEQGTQIFSNSHNKVPPEKIASYIARKSRDFDMIIDACCGVGSNTIQFAKNCQMVIAIDISNQQLQMCKKNCEIYKVSSKVEFVQSDYLRMKNTRLKNANLTFLQPSLEILNKNGLLDLKKGSKPSLILSLEKAYEQTKNIILLLPSNVEIFQIPDIICEMQEKLGKQLQGSSIEIEQIIVNGNLEFYIIYMGPITKIDINEEIQFVLDLLMENQKQFFSQQKKDELLRYIKVAKQKVGMRQVVRSLAKATVEMGTGNKVNDFLLNLSREPYKVFDENIVKNFSEYQTKQVSQSEQDFSLFSMKLGHLDLENQNNSFQNKQQENRQRVKTQDHSKGGLEENEKKRDQQANSMKSKKNSDSLKQKKSIAEEQIRKYISHSGVSKEQFSEIIISNSLENEQLPDESEFSSMPSPNFQMFQNHGSQEYKKVSLDDVDEEDEHEEKIAFQKKNQYNSVD